MTDPEVKECLDAGMQIWEIADKYEVSPKTVLNAIWRLDKQASKPKRIEYGNDDERFDLIPGDVITAVESEINQARRAYEVIEVYDHIYICKAIKGGWTTSFRKQDFNREHDGSAVKVSCRIRRAEN